MVTGAVFRTREPDRGVCEAGCLQGVAQEDQGPLSPEGPPSGMLNAR